jgi:hypothetical protein
MWSVKYHEVPVVLSAATLNRLEQACRSKRRVADFAVEMIRNAIFEIFPPKTKEDWRDPSRGEGALKTPLLLSYDYVCYALRRWTGRSGDPKEDVADDVKLTLKIPVGLMKWIDQIARDRQMTTSQTAVYAIEYGLQRLK